MKYTSHHRYIVPRRCTVPRWRDGGGRGVEQRKVKIQIFSVRCKQRGSTHKCPKFAQCFRPLLPREREREKGREDEKRATFLAIVELLNTTDARPFLRILCVCLYCCVGAAACLLFLCVLTAMITRVSFAAEQKGNCCAPFFQAAGRYSSQQVCWGGAHVFHFISNIITPFVILFCRLEAALFSRIWPDFSPKTYTAEYHI